MKKLITIVMLLVMGVCGMSARDKVYRDAGVLPAKAQATLKNNFSKAAVNRVKVDKNLLGKCDYEVILNNGFEVEFNDDGEWTEVDGGHKSVPAAFVLPAIRKYVASNCKGASIVRIDKDSNDYEIELSNGQELKFDRAGKFLRYDD